MPVKVQISLTFDFQTGARSIDAAQVAKGEAEAEAEEEVVAAAEAVEEEVHRGVVRTEMMGPTMAAEEWDMGMSRSRIGQAHNPPANLLLANKKRCPNDQVSRALLLNLHQHVRPSRRRLKKAPKSSLTVHRNQTSHAWQQQRQQHGLVRQSETTFQDHQSLLSR
jgi:hypothetical protein